MKKLFRATDLQKKRVLSNCKSPLEKLKKKKGRRRPEGHPGPASSLKITIEGKPMGGNGASR